MFLEACLIEAELVRFINTSSNESVQPGIYTRRETVRRLPSHHSLIAECIAI